jgi:hypothetical protein
MLPTSLSAVLGLCFILFGPAAVWLIFEASKRTQNPTARDRIVQAHRIAGYLFIFLFCMTALFVTAMVRAGP